MFLTEYDEKYALDNRQRTGKKEEWAISKVNTIRNFYNFAPMDILVHSTKLQPDFIEYIHNIIEEHPEWSDEKIAYEYGVEEYYPD